MVLRADSDWERNLEAVAAGASWFDFEVSPGSSLF
jgi:hypothetical protein